MQTKKSPYSAKIIQNIKTTPKIITKSPKFTIISQLLKEKEPLKVISSNLNIIEAHKSLVELISKTVQLVFGCQKTWTEISRKRFKEEYKILPYEIYAVHNPIKQTYKIIEKKKIMKFSAGYIYDTEYSTSFQNKVSILSICVDV